MSVVQFPLYGGSARSLRNRIGSDARARICVEALSCIDLGIVHGERVALVGHNGAGILVLASHSGSLLASLCTRALRLEHGRLVADGPLQDVIAPPQSSSPRRIPA